MKISYGTATGTHLFDDTTTNLIPHISDEITFRGETHKVSRVVQNRDDSGELRNIEVVLANSIPGY